MDITQYSRRKSHPVKIGGSTIGGDNPIAPQSMTNTSTMETEASVEQILKIQSAGCEIVRLTAQGEREAKNLESIVSAVRERGSSVAIVADIHYIAKAAIVAAEYVDKVRINPGNFPMHGGYFEQVIQTCRRRGAALRIGVNHGSLSKRIVDKYGDTAEGMVASAIEFLEWCQRLDFDQVVVSIKSSNTRVMVHTYRMLSQRMEELNMSYPLHLGVTEAGNGIDGRIKSAVGIGALLADGIGDTIRVSLTESPEREIPVAQIIIDHFKSRKGNFPITDSSQYSPTKYRRRSRVKTPIVHSELSSEFMVIEAVSENPTAELRAAILNLQSTQPMVIKRRYNDSDITTLAIKAAADLGALLLDGLSDGVWIDAPQHDASQIEQIEYALLQASRVRQTKSEYIACPSCGRTLFDIESRLAEVKARTEHLSHLKIAVMGCIVNGPGEMADADYGYIGAGVGEVTLYRAGEAVAKSVPQDEALDRLIEIIKEAGDWTQGC
ncbi:MAG: (E)-4-hydroxy-3-methylbut-2-enyl-diphosphate synthase [Rikenellaceae bacterium]